MADFLGIDASTWGAIQTIIIAVTGGAAFMASYLAIQEIRKDRKILFMRSQLDDFYSLILESDVGIRLQGILSNESFRKLRGRKYLAGPKLRNEFEEYSKTWAAVSSRTEDPSWTRKMKEEKGPRLIKVAIEEREDLILELNRIIFNRHWWGRN